MKKEEKDYLEKISKRREDVKKWIDEKETEQSERESYEDPAFTSEEVPLQAKSIERLVSKLSKKPSSSPIF